VMVPLLSLSMQSKRYFAFAWSNAPDIRFEPTRYRGRRQFARKGTKNDAQKNFSLSDFFIFFWF
jgi:hypothetical protein